MDRSRHAGMRPLVGRAAVVRSAVYLFFAVVCFSPNRQQHCTPFVVTTATNDITMK
jgi:hypothetical protein